MIEFELPGERTGGLHLPSSHQLIVEGTNIDETLSDINCIVETTNVTGRQLNSYDVQTSTPAGYDGVIMLSKRMASKTISVTVEIDAVDTSVLKEKVSALNALLRSARYIQFSDEVGLTYYVTYKGGSTPDDEATKQSFVLDFLWYDPLKYRDGHTIDYTNAKILELSTAEPVQPYIEIKFSTGIKEWSLRNTTTDLNINYSHENISSIYRLYFEEQTLTKNVTEVEAMDGLNIESDMEDFSIKDGDQLVVTPTPASITIKYRGVSL